MHAFAFFVTDFGDSAVTVPLALLTLAVLYLSGERRLALGWALAVGGTAAAIAALKIVVGGCGLPMLPFVVATPSGHTAMSAVVYGSMALLVGTRLSPVSRAALCAAAALAVVGVAASRVELREHTVGEVVVGLVVGAAGAGVFAAALRRRPAVKLRLGVLLLSGVVLVAAMHGTRWMIEPVLRTIAGALRGAEPWCG